MTDLDAMILRHRANPEFTDILGPMADAIDEQGYPGAMMTREGMSHALDPKRLIVGTDSHAQIRLPRPGAEPWRTSTLIQTSVQSEPHVWPENPRVILDVTHYTDPTTDARGAGRNGYTSFKIPVHSKAHLEHLMSDWGDSNEDKKEQVRAAVHPFLPDTHEPAKLARMKAPAGGIVVNNQMAAGGQFLPRAFKRIRDVAKKVFKLARPGEGHVTIAPGEPIMGTDFMHGIYDETGSKIGHVWVTPKDNGETLHINHVGVAGGIAGGGNTLGPAHVRAARTQLRTLYPNVKRFTGTRVSGALQKNAGSSQPIESPAKLDRDHNTPAWVTEHHPHHPHQDDMVAMNDTLEAANAPKEPVPVVSVPSLLAHVPPAPQLTLGQLKSIEDVHGLPQSKRLSPKVKQTGESFEHDDSRPFTAKVEHIAQFFEDLSRHKIGKGALAKILRDPKKADNEKLVHMIDHLGHELADMHGQSAANGVDWYGDKINQMDQKIHQIMTGGKPSALWGQMDQNGELVGKHDPATHHPAMAMFKALVAATSAAQNPVDNLKTAFKIWQAGHRVNPDDPLSAAPTYNHPAKTAWFQKLNELNKQEVPAPPDDARGKAKWYARYVYPFRSELTTAANPPGYSVLPSQILVHPDPTHPHHGALVRTIVNGKTINDPAGVKAAKMGQAKLVNAELPMTDKAGGVKSKGWTVRGAGVAAQMGKLQRLVKHFSGPNKTTQQAYHDATDWLFKTHTLEEMAPVLHSLGIKNLNTGFLKKTDLIPGAFILGPKFGPFFLNLHMNDPATREARGDYLTADKWWTRLWNRYAGRLMGKGGKINESPAGSKERQLMLRAARSAARKVGIPVAALQADLWYYEQQLWRMFGGEGMQSYDFADAAKRLPDKLKRGGKPIKLSTYSQLIRQHHAQHEANGEDSALYGLADHLMETDRPGAQIALAGAKHAFNPHVGGHEWQVVPRDWMEYSSYNGGPRLHSLLDSAIDLNGPIIAARWAMEKTPTFSKPGNMYVIPRIASNDMTKQVAPARLEVVHNGEPEPEHEQGQAWTRYNVPVFSKAHLAQMTGDLPEPMRAEIHRRLEPHLPETHEGAVKLSRPEEGFTHADFHRKILENPREHTTILAYADWLEEHDQPVLAEFMRNHVVGSHNGVGLHVDHGDNPVPTKPIVRMFRGLGEYRQRQLDRNGRPWGPRQKKTIELSVAMPHPDHPKEYISFRNDSFHDATGDPAKMAFMARRLIAEGHEPGNESAKKLPPLAPETNES